MKKTIIATLISIAVIAIVVFVFFLPEKKEEPKDGVLVYHNHLKTYFVLPMGKGDCA